MIFKSAEIRWFSRDREALLKIFRDCNPEGPGIQESKRTDHYLRLRSENTGIKLRQGRHEIKVKNSPDDHSLWGKIEHWTKWSYAEEQHILKQIHPKQFADWVKIEKVRSLKRYTFDDLGLLKNISSEYVDEGCSLEFTEVCITELNTTLFSIAFEAFSKSGKCKNNLIQTLKYLNFKHSELSHLDRMSYPELIRSYLFESK